MSKSILLICEWKIEYHVDKGRLALNLTEDEMERNIFKYANAMVRFYDQKDP